MGVPSVLRGQEVFIEGVGFIGKLMKAEMPKLDFDSVEHTAGGMTRSVDTGLLKAMEFKVEISDYDPLIFDTVAKRFGETTHLAVKKYIVNGESKKGASIRVAGNIKTQEFSNPDVGKEETITLTMAVSQYVLEVDGEEMYNIDTDNYILKINGNDLLSDLRHQIM
jgi:uncharacterized protein